MRFPFRYFLPTAFGLILAGTAQPALAQQTITCSSDDGGRHTCHVDARGGVQLTNQRSGAACQQGYSWGYDRDGIWVDHGCRADFTVNSFRRGGGGSGQIISCSSDDGGRHTCPVDARGGVQITNQRSGSACQQGYSWGYDANGIWVDHGCRADFAVNSINPYNGGGGGQSITCSSDDGGRHYCSADTRGGVQMVNQRSDARCQQGYSWGYDMQGIWVDHGCRADFAVSSFNPYNSGGSGGQTITCSSDDGGRHTCPADTRGGVQMVNQRSGSSCQQGYSWGYDQRGIWVDHGCRADFAVSSGNNRWNGGGGQTITCSSDDGGRHYCSVNTRGGVQMVNQRSDARCQQGYSWGYDQRGIWVDHGCRADFAVRR